MMTDLPLDLDLMPDTISDRDDIVPKIRSALADAPAHTTVDLPGVRLDLDFCAYPDGTPIWDKPLNGKLGGVRATRADGEVLDLTIDGQTWDELADALVDFMEDWPAILGSRLTVARDAARRRKRLADELNLARHAEREAVIAAHKAGATAYRLSKITGMSQVTIGTWTRKKAPQSED
ncbi:hypothetical protein [Corynebacterium neomassiliense]|uniref:hypothetical protein n=1 Tax=Corynebacterium neomassiliense TaxID=2079482 RepID=UPI001032356B|nr:hypothetical protein [Corynebacterium neomassiliense]